MYKLNPDGSISRLTDGATIPDDLLNRDRQDYQLWIDAGNTPEPYELPLTPTITVTPWQFRKALNQMNLRQDVETAVVNSGDQNLIDGWEFATAFVRTDPLVVSMGLALGKTDADMDHLFELAETL